MSTFRLIDFLENPALNALRFAMSAALVSRYGGKRQIRLLDEDAVRRLGKEGIDIDDFSEIKIEIDQTLSYKGKRVVIYIRDVKEYKSDQKLPKFHLSYCRTLEHMRQNSRWHRYVVANNDQGEFVVNFVGDKTRSKVMRLDVCQNCLEQIAWDGFTQQTPRPRKKSIVDGFRLIKFFEHFPKDLLSVMPTYTVDTAPLNDYSEDWGMISEAFKRDCGYVCIGCGLALKGTDRQYLHVHHRNGQKHNNSHDNLEALCLGCHAEEPMHSHMKANKSYATFIEKKAAGSFS